MRTPLRFVLTAVVALASGAALAQQQGFFRPTPDGDPSLTKYRPPPAASAQPLVRPFAVSAPAPAPQAIRGPDSNPTSAVAAIEQSRWTEEQLDRSVRESEADRMRAQTAVPAVVQTVAPAPPMAPGAYDGTTSERNR